MKKIVRKLFTLNAQPLDYILEQKMRTLISISNVLIILIPLFIIVYVVQGRLTITLLLVFIMLFVILLINSIFPRHGFYYLFSHIFLISLISAMWVIIFIDTRKPLISQIDTVIYIAALLSMTPLITIKRARAILFYYAVNAAIFIVYSYRIHAAHKLSRFVYTGYNLDVLFSFIIMCITSYFIFTSFRNAMLKSATAEMEIQAQNEELTAANEEFEAINEELTISQTKLENSERQYRILYQNALVGMGTLKIYPDRLVFIRANETAASMLNYTSPDDIIKKINLADLFKNPEDKELLLQELYTHQEIFGYEFPVKKNDNSTAWFAFSARIFPEQNNVEIVFIDISKRKIAEENIHKLTFYDPLTELPNKKLLMDNLRREIKKCLNHEKKRTERNLFSVICLGIDRFKNINDVHGTAIGDILLKLFAKRLKNLFRQNDVVSRFDGDKFMILLANIGTTDSIVKIIQKTRESCNQPFVIDNHELSVTSSFGVSVFPNDGESPEVISKNSEAALYIAKKHGRNSYHLYDDTLNKQLVTRIKMEEELRRAIQNNELVTYYQPKVDQHGVMFGMEALVRWKSPNKGLLHPCIFIPLAEQTGIITDIGSLVLKQACSQLKAWQDKGHKITPVSVNISPYEFNQEDLIAKVSTILESTGLSSEFLELEITESGIMYNETDVINKLNHLHDMQITLSIDDFGIGYSSLSKLKDFPIDNIKIEKSFVDNLPYDQTSITIATTIIDLAHNLGFKVIAEGIETQEQFDFLKEHDCDLYQGYYFSRPVISEKFALLLEKDNLLPDKRDEQS